MELQILYAATMCLSGYLLLFYILQTLRRLFSMKANEKWRKMHQTTVYQKTLFGIVADEAHVISKWKVDIFHLLCEPERISSRMF